MKAAEMRWIAAPLLLACLVLCPVAAGAQETPAAEPAVPPLELLRNGSFEETDSAGSPVSWRAEGLLVPGVAMGVVPPKNGRLGSKALRLKSVTAPAQLACFNGPFDVHQVAGQELEVSCFYRTRSSAGAYMDLDTYAEPFAEHGWETPYLTLEQHALDDTKDWTLLTWRMRCPPNAVEAVFILGATGAGELLIDDLSIHPARPPVRMEPSVLGDLVGWPARREVRLTVVNETTEERSLKVNLAVAGKRIGPRRPAPLRLGPSGREEVVIPYDLPIKGPHEVSLSLDDETRPGMYDALVAEVPALLTGRIVQPNFRGTLLSSIPVEEFVLEGRIAASEAICADISLEAELGGAGRIALEGKGITRPDGPRSWRLAFPREGMLTGRYWLNVSAVRDGKPVATLPFELARAAPGQHEVGFDSIGRLLVNGKPVFVNGLYNVTQPVDVDRAAAQGFNLIVVPTAAAGHDLVERVDALGLMMIVYSPTVSAPVALGEAAGSGPTFWEHAVQKYGELPSVVAWHLRSGPDTSLMQTDTFRYQQDEIARLDAYHPTVTRLSVPSLLPLYAPWCDIVAMESQPVPALAVDTVVTDLEDARAASRPGQPVWAVIQSVGRAWLVQGGGLEKGVSGRPPTGAEHRAMTLLALAHGAQGLLHHGFFFGDTKDRDEYLIPRDAPDLWEGMKATNMIIGQLSEALAAGTYRGVAISGSLHVGAWEHDGRLFVLAANSQPSAALSTFSVPGATPTALRRLDDGSEVLKTERGQFADDIPAYGGRVYVATLP